MNKKLTELLKDFMGEHNQLGEFTAVMYGGEYWIALNEKPILPFGEDGDKFITSGVMGARKIRQWEIEVETAVQSLIDSIDPNGFYTDTEDYDSDDLFYDMFDSEPAERQYIGSVFSLTPSGKYYTPWAHSNVDLIEAAKDSMFYEIVEKELDKLGYWLESGEGDPCDLFVCRALQEVSN